MLAFNPQFNIDEVIQIFENVQTQLDSNPFLYSVEGIFRLSGSQEKTSQLVADMLAHRRIVSHDFSAHDYIGAIKFVLADLKPVDTQNEVLRQFRDALLNDEPQDDAQFTINFITSLIESTDRAQYYLGQILYRYLNMATIASLCGAKNRMTPENLGILCGAQFANLICEDLPSLFPLTYRLNQICQRIIKNKVCLEAFEAKFAFAWQNMQKQILESLENEREVLKRIREKYVEKIIDFQKRNQMLKSQMDQESNGFTLNSKKKWLRKQHEYAIQQNENAIRILQQDDKVDTLKKLQWIELRINQIQKSLNAAKRPSKPMVFSMRKRSDFVPTFSPQSLKEIARDRQRMK